MNKPKRGQEFRFSFLDDPCYVTAVRKGMVYFRSGADKYQTPLELWIKRNEPPVPSSHKEKADDPC